MDPLLKKRNVHQTWFHDEVHHLKECVPFLETHMSPPKPEKESLKEIVFQLPTMSIIFSEALAAFAVSFREGVLLFNQKKSFF